MIKITSIVEIKIAKVWNDHTSVRGLVVMIVACQVMDPGSIPGERIFFAMLKK
jgi:hypothetical protein